MRTESARSSDTRQRAPRVTPLPAALGAEIGGVDLANLSDAEFAVISGALDRYSGLLIRNQKLSDQALVAFSARFGKLDHAPVQENGQTFVPGLPEVYVVSNILDDAGKPIGSLGAGEAVWHTDMSYLANPPDASLLYAIEVPPGGGDTWLCGMNEACRTLPKELRKAVEGKRLKHDGTYNSGGYLRAGVTASDDPRTSVGAVHPIICAHPRTGTPTLYLGRRRNAYIMDLPIEESEALLDALWAHATKPEFAYAHRWRVGDVLLWDNRATMHRRDPFDAKSRRLMHRTQMAGKAPPVAAE